MKKIVSVIILIMLIFLMYGCEKTTEKKINVPQSFACKIKTEYNNLNLYADVEHYNPGISKITILEPKNLKGLVINWNDNKTEVEYQGMKLDFVIEEYPDAAFIPAVLEFFDRYSAQNEIMLEKDENGNASIFRGQFSSGEYTAKINPMTSVIEYVEIPSVNLLINLSDFTALELTSTPEASA